jgi:resuscitation-promoting factor RpfA
VSALRPRKSARHAKPSKAAPVIAAGTLTTGLVAIDAAVLSTSALANAAPTYENFERLAQCESGGRWNINTGNGYYGGLQFSAATWRSVGMGGLPHQHSKDQQIQAGIRLQQRSGWGQWPACSRKLGLRGGGGAPAAAAPAPAPAAAAAPKANRSRTAAVKAAQVPFGGTVTTANVGQSRQDVRAWQARMRERGWKISVDGRFGPQSASVAQRFAAQKGLQAAPGSLNSTVYTAAWSLPVT